MDLKLITYPNVSLETKIEKEWDFDNPPYDAVELKEAMLKVMKDNLGIGLSANQVGITDVRCFVFFNQQANNSTSCETLCLHPSWEATDDSVNIDMWEACLSYPGVNLSINRPSTIRANWKDEHGTQFSEKLIGYQARCFIHECDHLDGITMDQHVTPVKWKEAVANAEAKKT